MSGRSEPSITRGGQGQNRRGRGRGGGGGGGRGGRDVRIVQSAPGATSHRPNDSTHSPSNPIRGASDLVGGPSSGPVENTSIVIPSTHGSSHLPSSQPESPISKLMIEPCGDEFFPYETINKVSLVIKEKYDEPWSDWSHIPANVKKMWFAEFGKHCQWEAKNHTEIVRIFKHKGAQVVRQSMADIRRNKAKGKWLPKRVLLALNQKWKNDEKFKEMSQRNKKNISNNDGRINHSGSISISERMRRYEKEMGRNVSIPELFEKLNYDKSKDKWKTTHAESKFDAFNKLKEVKVSQGEEVNDTALFLEANGGLDKKGRSFGFGSEARFYASTSRSSSISRTGCTQTNSTQVTELQSRLCVMEDKNNELETNLSLMQGKNQNLQASVDEMKSKLDNVIGLLEKFTGSSFAPSSSDHYSPSNPPRMPLINEDNNVDKDVGDDDGYDDDVEGEDECGNEGGDEDGGNNDDDDDQW